MLYVYAKRVKNRIVQQGEWKSAAEIFGREQNVDGRLRMRIKVILAIFVAGGFFVWMAGQCADCFSENRALKAENRELSNILADRNQTIDEKTAETEKLLAEKAARIEALQAQLEEAKLPEEYKTDSGFRKKNGCYLIDTAKQLMTLRDLLREGMEVEQGVPAASASYRLRHDITLNPQMWFCLGTEEHPFCGSFDGDGHSIEGRFPHMDEDWRFAFAEDMFHKDEAARIENLRVINDRSEGDICLKIVERRDSDELESHLPGLPWCSVHAEICEWGPDAEQTADALRRQWEQGERWDGYYVSLTLRSDLFQEEKKPADADREMQRMQEALCTLAGQEYEEMIREAMAQEEGFLWYVQLRQIGELTCCIFEVSEPAYSPYPINEQAYTPDCYPQLEKEADDTAYYYVALAGKWEGKEVKGQCFRIPYRFEGTESIGTSAAFGTCGRDVNFDGRQDLLIRDVGYKGSLHNCRALVWQEEAGQFAYFPSFPANVHHFETDLQRVVDNGAIGEWTSYVLIYEIVNGEYVCTKKLVCVDQEPADKEILELFYYEKGELVRTHTLSYGSDDWEEAIRQKSELYPDMDYWGS